MMEIEASPVVGRVVEALLDGKESLRLREIRASSAPSFVKTWFQLGVEGWYATESARRQAQSRFDFQDPDVQRLAHEFDSTIQGTARFSRTDCMKIIEGAVRHEMAYLHQPVSAISALLFQRAQVVDGRNVANLLTRFQRESFYIEALDSYIARHDDARLDQDLLEQLLSNVEQEAYQNHPLEMLTTAMTAVAEILCLTGGSMDSDRVSLDAWESFFETRHLGEYIQHYQTVIDAERGRGHQALSIQEMRDALQGALNPHTPPEPPPPADEAVPTPQFIVSPALTPESPPPMVPQSTQPPPEPVESVTDTVSEMQPPADLDRIPEPLPPPVQDASKPQESVPDLTPTIPSSDIDQGYSQPPNWSDTTIPVTQSEAVQDIPPGSGLPPVEISEKLERIFIRKLFNKDSQFYYEVLARLEKAASWEESFSIIEEVWEERGLNLFSKESQEFTRVFYERYYPSN